MTDPETFTSEDWQHLEDALLTSVDLIIAVSPQGAAGVLRESAAYYAEVSQLLQNGTAYDLIDELRVRTRARLDELQSAPPGEIMPEDRARRAVVERCRSAAQVLMGRADPAEAAYYKQGLLWACRQAALASREGGGFLGIGAADMTEGESQALRQVAFALGLPASEASVAAPPEAPFRPAPPGLSDAFSLEEWDRLRLAPLWTALAVSAVSPSGPIGLAQELAAIGRGLAEAYARQPPNSLVATLARDLMKNRASFETQPAPPFSLDKPPAPAQVIKAALDTCRAAVALVDGKVSPQEAHAYRRLLLDLAQQAAEAAREAGQRISPDEQRLLDELARLLGME